MRLHMPPSHRAFLAQLEAAPSVRGAVQRLTCHNIDQASTNSSHSFGGSDYSNSGSSGSNSRALSGAGLLEAYDTAVSELEKFRAQHRAFANSYIAQWSKKEVGTGGSDFMPALAGFRDATAAHKLSQGPRACPLH
eukprot:GHUV01058274.1.p1 GENE.GHUV01058274.1~~GHUV01058274.1.p1  ORF type:complete len:136 (-),score=37.15 GHUV01058274.1:55-462(-)